MSEKRTKAPHAATSKQRVHIKVTSLAIRASNSGDQESKDDGINMLPLTTLDMEGSGLYSHCGFHLLISSRESITSFVASTTLQHIREELQRALKGCLPHRVFYLRVR